MDKQIQRQLDTVTLDADGNPIVTYDADGNPQTDISKDDGLFDQQTEEGGIDDGRYEEMEQEIDTAIQFENWLYGRLMEDYGNVRFTDTVGKAYFKWWNHDYVTGKMFLEARLPLPGVDLAPYYAEAQEMGIPITQQLSETETQEAQSAAINGLGAFTDPKGFTITDVTAKWGTTEAAASRYTGDVGMSMVPYSANVQDEQLGYMAMSNLDGIESPSNIGGLQDDAGTSMKMLAGLGGGGILLAGMGVAGASLMFAGISSIQAIKLRKIAEQKAKGSGI